MPSHKQTMFEGIKPLTCAPVRFWQLWQPRLFPGTFCATCHEDPISFGADRASVLGRPNATSAEPHARGDEGEAFPEHPYRRGNLVDQAQGGRGRVVS